MVRPTSFERKTSPQKSKPRVRRLGVENLEDRRVLSADFGSAFAIGPGANGRDIAKDADGNTLVLGTLLTGATIDVDPGLGEYNLTHVPGGQNRFVVKYDNAGALVWVTSMGGQDYDVVSPRLATGSDGTVYVAGSFSGSAVFGTTTLTSPTGVPFVAKLDAGGTFLWAKQLFASTNYNSGSANSVAIDATGNAYVIGELRTASSSKPDTFITKLDSSGGVSWNKVVGVSTAPRGAGWARGFDIALDGAGNVYGTGVYSGTVDFNPGLGTETLKGSATPEFVLKLDAGGNFLWARSTVISGSLGSTWPYSIAADAAGNVYTAGSLWGVADFDPGKGKYSLGSSGGNLFVTKLDGNGNFAWAKSAFGSYGFLALDGAANVYMTGSFSGTVDFDPGPGTYNLTSTGGEDILVWKLDTNGSFGWAAGMGGTGDDRALGIAVDPSGNIYTTGSFVGPADFDPSPTGTYALTGSGLFVSKLVQSTPLAMAGMALTAGPQTTAASDSVVTAADSQPASSTTSTTPSTAPAVLLAPTNLPAKSKLADGALAQVASWLEDALEDDLFLDLAEAS